MSDFDCSPGAKQGSGAVSGYRAASPADGHEDRLRRYLSAVATTSSRAVERAQVEPEKAASERPERRVRRRFTPPRVRDVMEAPAVSVPDDMPFLKVAHTLSREHLSAVPVVSTACTRRVRARRRSRS